MAYDLRKGRLEPSEVDKEFTVKVAKQNLYRKTVKTIVITLAIIVVALVILLVGW
jgi:hypothetical protein